MAGGICLKIKSTQRKKKLTEERQQRHPVLHHFYYVEAIMSLLGWVSTTRDDTRMQVIAVIMSLVLSGSIFLSDQKVDL
jgi:hypothetical protein